MAHLSLNRVQNIFIMRSDLSNFQDYHGDSRFAAWFLSKLQVSQLLSRFDSKNTQKISRSVNIFVSTSPYKARLSDVHSKSISVIGGERSMDLLVGRQWSVELLVGVLWSVNLLVGGRWSVYLLVGGRWIYWSVVDGWCMCKSVVGRWSVDI